MNSNHLQNNAYLLHTYRKNIYIVEITKMLICLLTNYTKVMKEGLAQIKQDIPTTIKQPALIINVILSP